MVFWRLLFCLFLTTHKSAYVKMLGHWAPSVRTWCPGAPRKQVCLHLILVVASSASSAHSPRPSSAPKSWAAGDPAKKTCKSRVELEQQLLAVPQKPIPSQGRKLKVAAAGIGFWFSGYKIKSICPTLSKGEWPGSERFVNGKQWESHIFFLYH